MDHEDLMEELQESTEVAESEVIPEPIEEPMEEPVLYPADIQPHKKNNNAAVVVVTLLFILVIGLCVFIAVSLSDVLSKTEKKADAEYESETGNPWEEILGDDFLNKETETKESDSLLPEDSEYEFEEPDVQVPDALLPEMDETDPLAPYLSEIQSDDYPNYERESFEGMYYPEIVNSIDESVSYKIDRVTNIYKNSMYNVLFKNSYVELSGDIPNLDEINRTIREDVMSLEENYKAGGDNLNTMLYENNLSLYGESVAYVTYNSEDLISIVVKKDMELGYRTTDAVVYCYNIDLKSGDILSNSSVLMLDDDFAKEFRERSERQNGVSESMETYTDEQILAMLRDDRTLILFYTPLGLELGYNHSSGWITITMQDYEKYIALP